VVDIDPETVTVDGGVFATMLKVDSEKPAGRFTLTEPAATDPVCQEYDPAQLTLTEKLARLGTCALY
jgi:hypothetical protein